MAIAQWLPTSTVFDPDGHTVTGAASAHAACDDTVGADDGDTTYVQNNTGFNVFLIFGTSDSIPAGATINSVTPKLIVKGATGTPQFSIRLRVNGTDYDLEGSNFSTTGSYALYAPSNGLTTNPDTTAAWTLNDINGTGANPYQGFGLRNEDATRVTAGYLEIDYTPGAGGATQQLITLLGVG
jgi:hypothetical protein